MANNVTTTTLFVVSAAVLLISAGNGAFKKHNEALPMSGECTAVPLRKYVGSEDKDGKRCLWRGNVFSCSYDPNKSLWSCDLVEGINGPVNR